MYPISSSLTSQEHKFVAFRRTAAEQGFVLGGNWEYDGGSFDCALDDRNQVWLRLPFQVTLGSLDSETDDNDARIRLGEPYVLKHLYEEGLDRDAVPRGMSAMLDQFSDPVNPDAAVEPHWADKAKSKLKPIEAAYTD